MSDLLYATFYFLVPSSWSRVKFYLSAISYINLFLGEQIARRVRLEAILKVDVGQHHQGHDDTASDSRHDGLPQAAVDSGREDVVPALPRSSEGDKDERPEEEEPEPEVDVETDEKCLRPEIPLEHPLQVLNDHLLEAVILFVAFFHFSLIT